MSLYSEREKITELQETTDLDLEDLIEIVDRFGGPSSGPVSRKAKLSTLLSFIETQISTQEDTARVVRVDDDYPNNDGPAFNSIELAVDYARGIVNTQGGSVAIFTYYDSNGDSINDSLDSYSWYSQDPADSSIFVKSAVDASGSFFAKVAVGDPIDLNDIDRDYNLNNWRVDVNLGPDS